MWVSEYKHAYSRNLGAGNKKLYVNSDNPSGYPNPVRFMTKSARLRMQKECQAKNPCMQACMHARTDGWMVCVCGGDARIINVYKIQTRAQITTRDTKYGHTRTCQHACTRTRVRTTALMREAELRHRVAHEHCTCCYKQKHVGNKPQKSKRWDNTHKTQQGDREKHLQSLLPPHGTHRTQRKCNQTCEVWQHRQLYLKTHNTNWAKAQIG